MIAGFEGGFAQGLEGITSQFKYNFDQYINDILVYRAFRVDVLIVMFLAMVHIFTLTRLNRGKWINNGILEKRISANVFILFNLLSLTAAVFTLYDLSGDFRLLATNLILSLFLIIQFRQYKPVLFSIIINLLILPAFIWTFGTWWKYNFTYDSNSLEATRSLLEENIHYQPELENPWCNTILVPLSMYDIRVTQIPAGIGVSYYYEYAFRNIPNTSRYMWLNRLPLKSRYVWLNEETYDLLNQDGHVALQELSNTPLGTLYLNLDAQYPK